MRTVFVCNPARNTTCSKELCFERGGPCETTDRPEHAMRDLYGQPVRIEKRPSEIKEGGHKRIYAKETI